MDNRIILPLDNLAWESAEVIMQKTKGKVWGYKLRRTILDKGLCIIQKVKDYGNVMVDFKLYDIPSAMDESIIAHVESGADITTVHCTSGYKPQPELAKYVAGVTILTSMSMYQFEKYYRGMNISSAVRTMAIDCDTFNYGYMVCSAKDLDDLPSCKPKKICPGIRPLWYQKKDDQNRTMTPAAAIKAGADLLVIGRPILNSDDPLKAIERTNEEIQEVL